MKHEYFKANWGERKRRMKEEHICMCCCQSFNLNDCYVFTHINENGEKEEYMGHKKCLMWVKAQLDQLDQKE